MRSLYAVRIVDTHTAIVGGEYNLWADTWSAALRTTDGGDTWTHLLDLYDDLYALSFTDENNGTAVGRRGLLMRTTNAGADWTAQYSDTEHYLLGVCFTDAHTGTAVGDNGTILRTTTGGVTWVEEQATAPKGITLAQNYPNPFNPTTTIQYTLQKSGRVSLVVTDIYGRALRRLLDSSFQEAGSHQVQFDARRLPSGVYFYRLIADEQQWTRKMVLLR
jgi:hypothetical protein